jgi:hypothetical protein
MPQGPWDKARNQISALGKAQTIGAPRKPRSLLDAFQGAEKIGAPTMWDKGSLPLTDNDDANVFPPIRLFKSLSGGDALDAVGGPAKAIGTLSLAQRKLAADHFFDMVIPKLRIRAQYHNSGFLPTEIDKLSNALNKNYKGLTGFLERTIGLEDAGNASLTPRVGIVPNSSATIGPDGRLDAAGWKKFIELVKGVNQTVPGQYAHNPEFYSYPARLNANPSFVSNANSDQLEYVLGHEFSHLADVLYPDKTARHKYNKFNDLFSYWLNPQEIKAEAAGKKKLHRGFNRRLETTGSATDYTAMRDTPAGLQARDLLKLKEITNKMYYASEGNKENFFNYLARQDPDFMKSIGITPATAKLFEDYLLTRMFK